MPTLENGLALHESPTETPGARRVLWLHGYTLDSSSWSDVWAHFPDWNHLGLDLPGHGASEDIQRDGDLVSLGKRVAEICVREDIRQIVAISFGTITALQVLLELPNHFSAVVLGAPSMAGGPYDKQVALSYRRLGALLHMVGPGAAMTDAWLDTPPWEGLDSRPGLREQVTALVNKHRWGEMKPGCYQQFAMPPQVPADFARVTTPVRLIVGEHELASSKETAQILDGALPTSELSELPGLHHLCVLEDPAQAAALIRDHLEAHTSPPA